MLQERNQACLNSQKITRKTEQFYRHASPRRLLHAHLRHCLSPAPAVRRQSPAVCTATVDTGVRCSVVGPFLWPARRVGTRYQTIFGIRHVLLTVFVLIWTLFFSRYSLLAYTAHYRHCDYALYKSTIDTDIDIQVLITAWPWALTFWPLSHARRANSMHCLVGTDRHTKVTDATDYWPPAPGPPLTHSDELLLPCNCRLLQLSPACFRTCAAFVRLLNESLILSAVYNV